MELSMLAIERHRTAISRRALSSPMRVLDTRGFLNGSYNVLDYGCGLGDDVRLLQERAVRASGWDPHYFPYTPLVPADVVNLGFVLNVIEDPDERNHALCLAFSLTRRVLCVSVRLAGTGTGTPCGDGVITSRSTFQRYFTQRELMEYVQNVLGCSCLSVGPGIVIIYQS